MEKEELPKYSKNHDASVPQYGNNVPPPPPSYHEFAFVSNRLGRGHRVFLDIDTAEKYYSFKGKENEMVVDLQESGHAIPLMEYTTNFLLGNKKGTFSKGVPPSSGKPFDGSKDFVKYGSQKRSSHLAFSIYTLELPNTTIKLYRHRTIPIIDFTFKGNQYRWIYHRNRGFTYDAYTYTLYRLDNSLMTIMTRMENDKMDKNNQFNEGTFKQVVKAFTGFMRADDYVGDEQLAQLKCVRYEGIRRKVTEVLQVRMEPVHSVAEVDDIALMYISMASIFKTIEYERQAAERSI